MSGLAILLIEKGTFGLNGTRMLCAIDLFCPLHCIRDPSELMPSVVAKTRRFTKIFRGNFESYCLFRSTFLVIPFDCTKKLC